MPEKGILSCVPFCLWSLWRIERCTLFRKKGDLASCTAGKMKAVCNCSWVNREILYREIASFYLWARSMSVMALVWVPVGRAWGRLVVRVAGTQGEGGRGGGGGGSRGATRASKGWSATLVSGVVFATWKNLNSMKPKNGISYSNRSRYWSQKFINNFLLDPLPTPTFFVFSNLCSCN